MSKREDWLPGKRDEQLAMAKNWLALIKVKGKLAWRMDDEVIADFEDAMTLASDENSRPKKNRNASTNVLLRNAFEKLVAAMRDMKRRYFLVPPLTEADLVALGLKMKDVTMTPVGVPVGLVGATVKYVNEGALELNIRHVEGSPFDERANYGCKIVYGVFDASAQPITDVAQLRESRFVRRKRESFIFNKNDSRKVAYFCLRYENSKGQVGQWGQIISAVIP